MCRCQTTLSKQLLDCVARRGQNPSRLPEQDPQPWERVQLLPAHSSLPASQLALSKCQHFQQTNSFYTTTPLSLSNFLSTTLKFETARESTSMASAFSTCTSG